MSPAPYSTEEVCRWIHSFGHALTVSRGGRILAVNEAMLAVTGRPSGEVVGRELLELLSEEEHARIRDGGAAFRAAGAPPRIAFSVMGLRRDGRQIPLHVDATRVPVSDGEPVVVSHCFQLGETRSAGLANALAKASAAMLDERHAEGVREQVLRAIGGAGLWAGFYRLAGDRLEELCALAPAPAALEPRIAELALRGDRPTFGGDGPLVTHAYVGIPNEPGPPDVLVVSGPFALVESPVLTLFSRHVAAAYANAQLLSDLERRNEVNQLLLDMARTTGGTLETNAILSAACDYLVRLVDASNAFILLLDEEKKSLWGLFGSRKIRNDLRLITIPLDSHSLTALAARTRSVVYIEDLDHPSLPVNRELVEHFGQKAIAALPMVVRDRLLGVVVLDDTRGPRRFGPEMLELAQASVAQIGLAVANAKLYESLRESYARLEEARAAMVAKERLAALGELSAVVAHEVRNPLGVFFNAVSTLRRLVPREGDAAALVDILGEESDRLNRLVGELLDFARPRDLSLQPESVSVVIADSIEVASSDPGAPAVRFESSVEPGLPDVPMDRRLVRQALVNVELNARQAMPRGGTVRVRARREEREGRPLLRIDVEDEGPGMSRDVARRIFEPFFTTKAKGTGLGLAVVKRIAEEHLGSVEVTSAPGEGTTFSFRLPLGPGAPERGAR